jgi:predicted esterase YcpF (UPF0227 family)
MSALVYLHGFLSTPKSNKARLIADYLYRHHPEVRLQIPALPEAPEQALAAATAAVEQALVEAAGAPVGLAGSSLGGFYATVLSERFGLRAVVINPSVRPHRRFRQYFGEHLNPHTQRTFTLTERDAAALEYELPERITPHRYWLLAQTGDEVLDYREAVDYYAGARQTVEEGGDHMFQGFDRHLPGLVEFLNLGR